MTIIRDISKTPPSSETLIRVYRAGQVSFSRAAAKLLCLEDGAKVAFVFGKVTSDLVMPYVTRRDSLAYKVTRNGGQFRIRSKALCESLARELDGYGTYRIEPENIEKDMNGNVYYPIFFRNLNKSYAD